MRPPEKGQPELPIGLLDSGARRGHSALPRVGGRSWQDRSMDGIERRRLHLPFKVVRACFGRSEVVVRGGGSSGTQE